MPSQYGSNQNFLDWFYGGQGLSTPGSDLAPAPTNDPRAAALGDRKFGEKLSDDLIAQLRQAGLGGILERNLGLAEQVFASRAPMRQFGLGALANLAQNPYGIFMPTDPSNPGSLAGRAPVPLPMGPDPVATAMAGGVPTLPQPQQTGRPQDPETFKGLQGGGLRSDLIDLIRRMSGRG